MLANRQSEVRKAFLLNKYVIITPGRAKRPRDIKEETIIKRTSECPFCPGNLSGNKILDRIDRKDGKWRISSIENIFPAVTLRNKKAYGVQEVIIETRDHIKELADLKVGEVEMVLRMYSHRTKALIKNKDIDYVLCFKNQGSKAGASIVHAHSQVFATKILPPELHQEWTLAQAYEVKHHTCPYCDMVKKEINSERKIYEDKYVAAFTPYASEYHYEAWIFTKRHVDNITELNNKEFRAFANAYKKILLKLQALNISFNCFMHNVVSNRGQHLYLKIQPRDSVWAGVELGSGLVINSVPPEAAAKYYREQ